jgi:hypothetical protein
MPSNFFSTTQFQRKRKKLGLLSIYKFSLVPTFKYFASLMLKKSNVKPDQYPAFLVNADPDPAFLLNADPDPWF